LLEASPGHWAACHLTLAKKQKIWAQLSAGEAAKPDAELEQGVTEVEAS
jgi:hypothetical protein